MVSFSGMVQILRIDVRKTERQDAVRPAGNASNLSKARRGIRRVARFPGWVIITCHSLFLAVILVAISAGGQMTSAQSTAVSIAPAGVTSDPESVFSRIVPDDCKSPTAGDLEAVKAALNEFRRTKNSNSTARALSLLGILYQNTGQYKQSLPYLREALQIFQQRKDPDNQAIVLTRIGTAYDYLGKDGLARSNLNESLLITEKQGNLGGQASALAARAELTDSQNRQATEDLRRGLVLAKEVNDLKTQAIILNDEGVSAGESDNPEEEAGLLQTAVAIEDQIHDCREKADTFSNMATYLEERGHASGALDNYNKALDLEGQVGDLSAKADMSHAFGHFYLDLGDFDEAFSLFKQSIEIKLKLGNLGDAGKTQIEVAGIYREEGKLTQSVHAYLANLPLLQQVNDMEAQVITLNNLGADEGDLHHPTEARSYYNRSIQMAARVGDPITPAFSAWGIGELEQSDAL